MKKLIKNSHTFVVPTYLQSPYLEDCLKSLESQKIKSKIIITTAKPFKNLKKISKKYNAKLFIFSKHRNIANDWNRALSKCETNLVTIAHQDDIYCNDFTSNLKKITAKDNVDFLLIFSNYLELRNKVVTLSIKILIKRFLLLFFFLGKNCISGRKKKWLLKFGSPIPCPTVTLNMKYKPKFDEKFWSNIDWKLWLDLSKKKGRFVYIKKNLVYHRIHNSSETFKAINNGKRLEEDKIILKKIWGNRISKIILFFYKFSYNLSS